MSENEVVVAETRARAAFSKSRPASFHASTDECKKLDVFPNLLAYHEASATLVLIVQKSMKRNQLRAGGCGVGVSRRNRLQEHDGELCGAPLHSRPGLILKNRAGSRRALKGREEFCAPRDARPSQRP